MPENELQRAQRIADEVMRDPKWRQRDDDEQFVEMKRRIESADEAQREAVVATRSQIVTASELESARVYPNFQRLRTPFELGFLAGAQWAQNHQDGSTK